LEIVESFRGAGGFVDDSFSLRTPQELLTQFKHLENLFTILKLFTVPSSSLKCLPRNSTQTFSIANHLQSSSFSIARLNISKELFIITESTTFHHQHLTFYCCSLNFEACPRDWRMCLNIHICSLNCWLIQIDGRRQT
jgi:hypothetical protein